MEKFHIVNCNEAKYAVFGHSTEDSQFGEGYGVIAWTIDPITAKRIANHVNQFCGDAKVDVVNDVDEYCKSIQIDILDNL